MTVTKDVVKNGRKMLSAGAKLHGRWHYIGCSDSPVAYCFATLKTESYEDGAHSGPFTAAPASSSLEFDVMAGGRSIEHGRGVLIPRENLAPRNAEPPRSTRVL